MAGICNHAFKCSTEASAGKAAGSTCESPNEFHLRQAANTRLNGHLGAQLTVC